MSEVTDKAAAEWARQGSVVFRRALGHLTDEAFDGPTLLPGWRRRELVAHVGYNARALARLVDWARTGVPTRMYPSAAARDEEITEGARCSPAELRLLFDRSAAELEAKWRALPEPCWSAPVRTAQDRTVPVLETFWMRAREVWIHAVDLRAGVGFQDFPDRMAAELVSDVVGLWRRDGKGPALRLFPADADTEWLLPGDEPAAEVYGRTADLARWVTGRGERGLRSGTGPLPALPGWL